jgi:hypothetical protein
VRILCYTNGTSARLFLNGKPVDATFQRDPQSDILYTDIRYEPGVLRCEADNGASYEIKTSKAPYALRLTTDSLAHVFVEVVDEDGVPVKSADNEVRLQVRGARLLGMENGDIMDSSITGRQQRNMLRVHQGRLVAYLDAHENDVQVTATSPFLKPAQLSISQTRSMAK